MRALLQLIFPRTINEVLLKSKFAHNESGPGNDLKMIPKHKSTMHCLLRSRISALLISLILLLGPVSIGDGQSSVKISSAEQIKEDIEAVPCNNEERLQAVKALFERAGAPATDASIDTYKNVENFVVIKKGESEERIVVGAHYDKVSEGCGAIDNWTGIVALAHLYRALKDVPLKKTLVLVAFGKEEIGLVGSRAMANAMSKDQAEQTCAMINIDSLGLGAPQVAENMSSRKLGEFVAELAKEIKMPFGHTIIKGADSDSTPFIGKKIPAVTIHGMTNDWHSILHSSNDRASKVNPASVYQGYRLALAVIVRLDQSLCSAYR